MSRRSHGVLVAIDWERIRRSAQLYQRIVTPAELCRAMREVGRYVRSGRRAARPSGTGRYGLMTVGRFTDEGMVLYHAPRTGAGKDRTDPAILLEVYEWIRDREDCGTVVLGSGDADYQVLVDRARIHGRRIVLCAFSQSVSRDMLATAPLFPLEAELGIQLAEHGRRRTCPFSGSRSRADAGIDDALERFVREMDRLEGRMNFVGYSMLCNQWMLDWGLAWNEYECRRLVDEYQAGGDRGAPRGGQPQQSRLAHIGGALGPERRASAPGVGVQRRTRL